MIMAGSWTFGRKVGSGFALVLFLAALSGLFSISTLKRVTAAKDHVLDLYGRNLVQAGNLSTAIEYKAAAVRGYLLSREDANRQRFAEARKEIQVILGGFRDRATTDEERRLLTEIESAEADLEISNEKVLGQRADTSRLGSAAVFLHEISPKKDRLQKNVREFVKFEEHLLETGRADANKVSEVAARWLMAIVALIFLIGIGSAYFLTRSLSRQIAAAVQHVQTSSAELQAAANQQATGSREQSTSMSEIATTISELLATSRQIAESAQHVAQISRETAQAAGAGEQTGQKSQESIGSIRRQVDAIVNHMLDLGKKSQQIGGILEIINELAEQTNILAINASVEAAGAGEAGRRFGVVADEIRKLADRVGGSTKEIRSLIEEIRAAVNTTVMATEGGAKSVEAGAKQFGEVAAAFQKIMRLVDMSTEAAKEIELSTKQQATAVEQVNVAVANVSQASKESEASAGQILQTAGQLFSLSRDLLVLVQSGGGAPAPH
jgi:methyl-accepting chemotaxis protein